MRYNYILFSFLIALLIFPSCDSEKKKEEKLKEEEMAMEENMPVEVAVPQVKDVLLTQIYPGHIEDIQEVQIVARVNGVLKVHAPSGAEVRKGQVLYTIVNDKYDNDVKQAEASLKTAEASLKTAQANYDYYSKELTAREEAFKKNAVSAMELAQTQSEMEQAQASINESRASIENARAALNMARTTLGYCTITAPFNGKLALQAYDEDSYINGENSPVTLNTLYNDKTVYALISIDEKKFATVRDNAESGKLNLDSVKINFSAPLQHEYFSKINYSAPDVNVSTGTVTLRFEIDNRYNELQSGMYMTVALPYADDKNALLVRDASIGTDQLGKYLYLVNDSNKIVYTPIEVGETYLDTLRIVTKGVTPESRYVTTALLKVRDGQKVKPVVK